MLFGKYVNQFYKKYFWFFVAGLLALLAVNYFQLFIPEIFGKIVDGISDGTIINNPELITEMLLKIGGIAIIMFTGRFAWRYAIFGIGVRVEADMRHMMFVHSEKLSETYYKKNKTGALMALYTNDLFTIKEIFGRGTVMLIDFIFLGSMVIIKMFMLNWMLTLIVLGPALLLGFVFMKFGKRMQKKFKILQKSHATISDFTQENISGISVIKAFVRENGKAKEFEEINQDNYGKSIDYLKTYMGFNSFLMIILNLVISGFCALGSYLILGDKMGFTTGELLTFISYFNTLTWPMMAIGLVINLRSQAKASLNRVTELLDEDPEIKDNHNTNYEIAGEICFNHLNFCYSDDPKPVLNDINFTIKKGEIVGILGHTGCGKTTLVDLLLRMYNLEKNSILLDGNDIMDISVKTVRDAIGYVPQDNFLFSDTVRNNIAFSNMNILDENIIEAAKLADVDENIKGFTEGYETMVGERGVTLSGGQKQRISIARALLKNPPIMIFDDSVSAVDTKTEESILRNLRETRKGKTTIMVSHRISTVKNLDKIILLDEGKIVGIGNHESLLATSKLYQKMVNLQALEKEVN